MDTLKTEIKEKGVFVITLNRPKVLNSLNKEIIDELLEAFDKAYEDQSIRTCLLYTSPSPRDRISSRMPSSA